MNTVKKHLPSIQSPERVEMCSQVTCIVCNNDTFNDYNIIRIILSRFVKENGVLIWSPTAVLCDYN